VITALWICIGVSLAVNILMVLGYNSLYTLIQSKRDEHDGPLYNIAKKEIVELDRKLELDIRRRLESQISRISSESYQHSRKLMTLQPLINCLEHKDSMSRWAEYQAFGPPFACTDIKEKAAHEAKDHATFLELKKRIGDILDK